jgi:hypothetical protein
MFLVFFQQISSPRAALWFPHMDSRTPQKPYEMLVLAIDKRRRKRKIRKIDTHVPLRSEGRDTDHCEIYSIVGMLNTLPPNELNYPVQVVHRDRPDFLLIMATHQVGVEVTEAVSENTASMDKLRESEPDLTDSKDDEAQFFFSRKAVLGEEKIYAAVLRDMIRANNPGGGWVGNGAKEWAEALAHVVTSKVEKANKPGFNSFTQNWLLIYDNWDEPARRRDLADEYLLHMLREKSTFQTFDRVLVLDGRELASFTVEGAARRKIPRHTF